MISKQTYYRYSQPNKVLYGGTEDQNFELRKETHDCLLGLVTHSVLVIIVLVYSIVVFHLSIVVVLVRPIKGYFVKRQMDGVRIKVILVLVNEPENSDDEANYVIRLDVMVLCVDFEMTEKHVSIMSIVQKRYEIRQALNTTTTQLA